MSDTPLEIAVWPSAFVPGGEPTVRAPLDEALGPIDCDAHAVGYLVPGGDVRVRKDLVEGLVAEGRTPMQHYALVDLDTPDHGALDPEVAVLCAHALVEVAQEFVGATPITYTTRAGVRLVFVLSEPVDVRQANPVLERIRDQLAEGWLAVWPDPPVLVDDSTAQWTRAFRLPKVERDGTTLDGKVTREWTPLDPGSLPEPEVYTSTPRLDDFVLTEVPKGLWYHRLRPSHKAYRLRDRIAEGEPLPFSDGRWHEGLVKVVGCLCSVMAKGSESPETLAGSVISVLTPSIIAGADDAQHDLDQLRDLALRFAPNSWEPPAAEDLDMTDDVPDRPDTLIVGHPTASAYWIWEGRWTGPLSGGGAATRLARAYPDLPFATKSNTPYPGHKLVYLYGQTADEVCYSAFREGLEGHKLTVQLYSGRGSIPAVRDPDVEEWLDIVDPSGRVQAWLSWLGDLSTPIPAMLWHGIKGVGKGMMAEALATYFGGALTDWRRLGGDTFASAGFLDSPLVWGDEFGGFADERQSEVFREMVGNTAHTVRQMRVSPMKIDTALRVFLGTNESHALTIRGRASQESLHAVRDRIVGIAVPKAAATYLEERGGRGGLTKDWVRLPDGSPGKLVQHLAHLQTLRPASFSGRYPVEAYTAPLLARGAILGNDEEAMVWLAAATSVLHNQGGCLIRMRGEVLINPRALSAGWNQLQLGAHSAMSVTEITGVVKRFSQGIERVDNKRYHRVPGDYLLATLEDIGHDGADRLAESLVTGNVIQAPRRRGLSKEAT